MPCFYPLEAYANPSGGRVLFSRPPGHSGRVQHIKCGQCMGCRRDDQIEWSVRCFHESVLWKESWFLTFTYDDEHLPSSGSVSKREVQTLFKRLAKAAKAAGLLEGSGLRRFGNAEYGTQTLRAHYHAIVFGLALNDLKRWKKNERGEQMWTSAFLERAWGKGRVVVGQVTPDSVAYVAGYTVRDKEAKRVPYGVLEPHTGEIVERVPPFRYMSRRPGVGSAFLDKFLPQFQHDYCVLNGRKVPTPQYYRRRLAEVWPELAERLSEQREALAFTPQAKRERRPARLAVRAEVADAKRRFARKGSRGGL